MITKIDSTNQAKYDILFANAMKDLRKNPEWADVEINSLESYFSNINKLLNLADKSVDYRRRYTILPLDENYFNIDTNTRMIEVPASFRKNGVGVQGDMGAETIYFKVPRYFDAMDLNNTDIYIQWQYTNSQNGQSEQGISREWVRDIESEDDYLIFGWVLGGRITEEAGSLQFSVRFIRGQKDDDKNVTEISYSLSTLTATVMINPGLNYDIDIPGMVETLDDIISSNFIDTTTKTDSEIDIFRYVWDLDRLFIGQLEEGKKIPTIIERDLDSDGTLKIQLSSYVSPGEILSYSLYKQTKDEPSINMDSETKIDMSIKYLPTEDKSYQENGPKMYYEEKGVDEEGNPKYSRYWPENLSNTSLPEGLTEKYGIITLNKNTMDNIAGIYYGVARAVINGNQSGPQYTDHKLLIAGPIKPILDNENMVYTKYTTTTTENGTVEYPVLPVALKQYGEKDALTFSWYKFISETVDEDNKAIREGTWIKDTSSINGFTPETTGKYYAIVKATRNFTNSETIETDNYIVTEKPRKPVIDEQPKSGALSLPIKFSATDQNDSSITESILKYNLYTVTYEGENPQYTRIATADAPEFIVNSAGNYACGAYSVYNELPSEIAYTNVIVRQ